MDKQQVMSLKNTLLESSSQKTRSPIFPYPYSRASSSQVQLHLDTRFLGNSNSPLIRTKSDSLGFTSYVYCKFNFENPKPRSQQCFVAPFLCISPVIPVTASDFMLCLSEMQSPNALRASIFSSCAVPYLPPHPPPPPILFSWIFRPFAQSLTRRLVSQHRYPRLVSTAIILSAS